MSLIGSILNPLQPQPSSPSPSGSGGSSEPDNPNTVTPTEGSGSTGSSGSGTSTSAGTGGNGTSSSGSGTGGESSGGASNGTTASGNAGLLSRAAGTGADGSREARGTSESDAAIRFRAENAGKAFQTERSVVERLFEINPNAKVTDIISRIESSESDEAKINSQRFVERLSEVRQAEAPVEISRDGPVFLDTNDSSEPVGRYDKSA